MDDKRARDTPREAFPMPDEPAASHDDPAITRVYDEMRSIAGACAKLAYRANLCAARMVEQSRPGVRGAAQLDREAVSGDD